MAKKTVRFEQLIQGSGEPRQVMLWTKPEDDAPFMRAVKENRVTTVVQRNVGTKKDFGLVGFFPDRKGAYIVFPKPIAFEAETKVIGIKYDRIQAATAEGPIYEKPSKPGKTRNQAKRNREPVNARGEAKQERVPVPKTALYRASVELTAKQRVEIEVEAASLRDAVRSIKERAAEVQLDTEKAIITRKVGKPVKRKGK